MKKCFLFAFAVFLFMSKINAKESVLQFCAGLTNLIIQDKNFVDCDWGSDNLCSVNHDLNMNIEENYVDVIAV